MSQEPEKLPALLLDTVPDDGVVANQPFKGFDGHSATVACGYSVKGRLVALRGTQDETLYGTLKDKVVKRVDGGWIASWWLEAEDPLRLAKRSIGSAATTSINTDAVQIDDAELLGTSGRKPGDLAEKDWNAGVTGSLIATVLGAAVPLRPDRIERKQSVVTFTEHPAAGGSRAGHTLKISWKYAERESSLQRVDAGLALDASVALLMDEVADGAWEAGSPLWIRTTNGFVRWHSKQGDSLAYRATLEGRNVDVTGWLPALPAGGFARLLLDASGDKVLEVETDSRIATLTIQDPALMIAMPRACCNGRDLAVPLLPPDDAAMTGTLCIVTRALAPSDSFCTAAVKVLTADDSTRPQLELTANDPDADTSTRYFVPSGNWVRPAESAANATAGLSRARVLLPHGVPAGVFKLVVGQDLTVEGAGELDLLAATSVALPAVGELARTIDGPLARFDITATGEADFGSEIWPPSLALETSQEPVVLRSLYRRSSAAGAFAADELPPYAATRVVAADVAIPTVPRLPLSEAHTRWHYVQGAPTSQAPQLRYTPQHPDGRRGWVEGVQFVKRLTTEKGPIEYAEFNGIANPVWNWLRLSNDTLIPRAAQTPVTDPLVTPLGERDASEERGGLALLILQETLPATIDGSSSFVLQLDLVSNQQDPVVIELKPPKNPVVNRLVIAVANPKCGATPEEQAAAAKAKHLQDPCRLALTTLNRLYLELEREGDHFIVRRGMLGWNASAAFGLNADAGVGLEVTEMFERKAGRLVRTVEFNGALSVVRAENAIQSEGDSSTQNYCLTAYLWAATYRFAEAPATPTLRVIGYHGWSDTNAARKWFASIQDARVAAGRLDLSADLVLIVGKTESTAASRGADSPWQAVRRHLYSVMLDTTLGSEDRPSNLIAGFLKLRHAGTRQFKVIEDPKDGDVHLIPDWRATERDVVPLFSDLPRPARTDRSMWLRADGEKTQRLGASTTGTPGKELQVVLHRFIKDVKPGQMPTLFACCLVGDIQRQKGIPRWVPAPVQGGGQPPAKPPEVPAAANAVCRLWLFDGPPRMVDEWMPEPAGTPEDARILAEQRAQRTLARLGWTREAVLESNPGTSLQSVTWAVVDSPLLNREASIGWFAWPLTSPGDSNAPARWPQDTLPRTQAVPQYEGKAPRAFAIEVAFKDDLPPDGPSGGPAVASPLSVDLASTDHTGEVSVPVKLRSAGLRAGAWYRLVDYDQGTIGSRMFSPAALPERGQPGQLFIDPDPARPGLLRWDKREHVTFPITAPIAGEAPENTYLLDAPDNALSVKVVQCDDDLMLLARDGTSQKVDRTKSYEVWKETADGKRVGIRMPPGKPFKTLLVEFLAAPAPGSPLGTLEQRKYFDGGAERLAGLFDASQQLQVFGTEQVSFYPDESELPNLRWTRFAEWQDSARQGGATAGWYIATVDIEGRLTLYRQEAAPA